MPAYSCLIKNDRIIKTIIIMAIVFTLLLVNQIYARADQGQNQDRDSQIVTAYNDANECR